MPTAKCELYADTCCLTNQWQTSAAESSERGGGSRVAPATATKYPHVLRRLCDMASLSRHKISNVTDALRLSFLNQRLGEGHPDRKPRLTPPQNGCEVDSHERPAVYPTFALRATRGAWATIQDHESLHVTSTHEIVVGNLKVWGALGPCPTAGYITTKVFHQ